MQKRRLLILVASAGLVLAQSAAVLPQASANVPGNGGSYVSVSAANILNTSSGVGAPRRALPSHSTLTVHVAGHGGVPATGASEVMLTVFVMSPARSGWLVAFATGTARPAVASLDFSAGRTNTGSVLSELGSSGSVSIYNGSAGSIQVVANTAGYFTAGQSSAAGSFVPLRPVNIFNSPGGLPPHSALNVAVAGRGGVPSTGTIAVVASIGITDPTLSGWATAYRANSEDDPNSPVLQGGYASYQRPGVANLEFAAHANTASLAVVPLGFRGTINVYNGSSGGAGLQINVLGYYRFETPTMSGSYVALDGANVLDTRHGIGAPARPVSAGGVASVFVAGQGGVPSTGVAEVAVVIIPVQPTVSGWLTAYADGQRRPTGATLDPVAGSTTGSLALVPVGANGRIDFYNGSTRSIQLVANVVGYLLQTDPGLTWAWGATAPATDGGQWALETQPVPGLNLHGITAVTDNGDHAVLSDGTVWSWGDDTYGELGNGTVHPIEWLAGTPVQAQGLTDVVAMSSTHSDAYALRSDGTVWGWGDDGLYQLGPKPSNSCDCYPAPVEIGGLDHVTAVAADATGALAVRDDGTVWAWGTNYYSQIAATGWNYPTPVQIAGVGDAVAISSLGDTAYALKSDGTVWSWGLNNVGQMGDGILSTNRCQCDATPTQVQGLAHVAAVGGAVALANDGTVWVWADNSVGELGDGAVSSTGCQCATVPTQVPGLSDVTAVAGEDSRYALRGDGTVWAWGSNREGQLGNGSLGTADCYCVATPAPVAGVTGISLIAAPQNGVIAVHRPS